MQPGALELNRLREVEKADPCVLVIQPLTTREIRYFLEGQEEAGQGLLNRLYDTSLFDLAGTPYFLFKMLVKARKNALPRRARVSCTS